jgi:hypothetical protein
VREILINNNKSIEYLYQMSIKVPARLVSTWLNEKR